MKRRKFLEAVTAGVLAATPAMQVAALVRDFGVPSTSLIDVKWTSLHPPAAAVVRHITMIFRVTEVE